MTLLSACTLFGQESPAFAAAVDPGPSIIAMPLRINLDALFAEAERVVPKVPPGVETWAPFPEGKKPGMRLRFNLYREALNLQMNGPRFTVQTHAHYWMEVGLHVAGNYVKSMGSCGQGKEGFREVILGAEAEVAFTPDWGMDVKTSVLPPQAVNPCQITFLNYDITPKVVKGMEEEMAKASADLGRQLRTTALLRQKAETAWNLLQTPIELVPGIHLSMNPERIRLSPLVTAGKTLIVTPEISARPTVTFGPKPAPGSRTLPALEPSTVPIPPGFHMRLQADVPFEEATAQMVRQMVGRSFETEKGQIEVVEAQVRGENGKAIVDITVKGRITGRITLAGRPVVDLATNSMQLRDLDYTLESRSWLVRTGEWFFRSSLRQMIQEKANFFMAQGLQEARTQVNQHLNRALVPGLSLRGELRELKMEQPMVLSDRFRVEASLEGNLEAVLTDLTELTKTATF